MTRRDRSSERRMKETERDIGMVLGSGITTASTAERKSFKVTPGRPKVLSKIYGLNRDWTEFRKTFTKEQEKAIWQYFIDHSTIERNAYWKITFHVRNVDDFWRRVYSRFTGHFHRYEILEKTHLQENKYWFVHKEEEFRRHQTALAIDKGRDYYKKLQLYLYRKLNKKIFKHEIQKASVDRPRDSKEALKAKYK